MKQVKQNLLNTAIGAVFGVFLGIAVIGLTYDDQAPTKADYEKLESRITTLEQQN